MNEVRGESVLQQLWAVLIIAQILHAVQMEVAGSAQVDPFDVSLKFLTQFVPQLAFAGKHPIQMIVDDGRRVNIIRSSRRIRIQTPPVDPTNLLPLPPDKVLVRKPRDAQRQCDPQSHLEAKKKRFLAAQPASLSP